MMNRAMVFLTLALMILFPVGHATHAGAQTAPPPSKLPLLSLKDFHYVGAFRVPKKTFGASSLNYSQGPIEYNPAHHSLFIVGHAHHQAIAEFRIPKLVSSTNLRELAMAEPPLQSFSTVLDRVPGGNPQKLNRIGGMKVVSGPNGDELLVNAYEYYDASGDVTHTTLVIRDADKLASSSVDGFYSFKGKAGHTSGWISPIPPEWQVILGGTLITGHASGFPIIGRLSVGPSAFAFDPMALVGTTSVPNPVPTTTLLDFSLDTPLHSDLRNESRTNTLWTHLSRAVYGFIPPGTRTYVTVGSSGGHVSGVCYKCTQNNGKLCGGYCAPDSDDYYHYYWLWDVNDLLAVKEGRMKSYDVRPYEYGKFPTPFPTNRLGGGSFDPTTGLLYLTVQRADNLQGQYANPPVIVAYTFKGGTETTEPGVPRTR